MRSEGPGFKFFFDHKLELFVSSPNSLTICVNSQLVCLLPVGDLNFFMFIFSIILFLRFPSLHVF